MRKTGNRFLAVFLVFVLCFSLTSMITYAADAGDSINQPTEGFEPGTEDLTDPETPTDPAPQDPADPGTPTPAEDDPLPTDEEAPVVATTSNAPFTTGVVAGASYNNSGKRAVFLEDRSDINTLFLYPVQSYGDSIFVSLNSGYRFVSTSIPTDNYDDGITNASLDSSGNLVIELDYSTLTYATNQSSDITGIEIEEDGQTTTEPITIKLKASAAWTVTRSEGGTVEIKDANAGIPDGYNGVADISTMAILAKPDADHTLHSATLRINGGEEINLIDMGLTADAEFLISDVLLVEHVGPYSYTLNVTFAGPPSVPALTAAAYNGEALYTQKNDSHNNSEYTVAAPVQTIGNDSIVLTFSQPVTGASTPASMPNPAFDGSTVTIPLSGNPTDYTIWDTPAATVEFADNVTLNVAVFGSAMIRNTLSGSGTVVYSYDGSTKPGDTIDRNITNFLDPGASIVATLTPAQGHHIANRNAYNFAGRTWTDSNPTANGASYIYYLNELEPIIYNATATFTPDSSGGNNTGSSRNSSSSGSSGSGTTAATSSSIETLSDGGSGGYRFRVNQPLSGFLYARVDGETLLQGQQFFLEEGSTILTLSDSYVATLSPGRHHLSMKFWATSVSTEFTVTAAGAVVADPVAEAQSETEAESGPQPALTLQDNANPDTGGPQIYSGVGTTAASLTATAAPMAVTQPARNPISLLRLLGCLVISLIVAMGFWAFLPRKSDYEDMAGTASL